MATQQNPITVFVSYAHSDEKLLRKLEKHLGMLKQQGLISTWYDRKILPGADWAKTIDQHLEQASIILLLVSADFLASDYCYQIEMKCALEREKAGQARVIPVIMRPVDWKKAPFGYLQALPTGAKPVTGQGWHNQDEAFADIAHDIRKAVEELNEKQHIKSNNARVNLAETTQSNQPGAPSKPTHIRFTYQPSREGNKGVALFILNGTEYALEYIRYDKITHQIFFLKQKQEELVRMVVPFATLKPLEKHAEFQIDGVDGLFTFKMSAIASIMSVKLEVGGVEIFRQ